MKKQPLSPIPQEGQSLLFEDEVNDCLVAKGIRIQTSRFLRIGARDAQFEDSALTQCLFEDVYLRKAQFKKVDLTGSRFRRCNLGKASFQECDLRFCTFEATHINSKELLANMPNEPNLRLELARNLRRNYEDLGDKKSADAFLKVEIEAHEAELLNRFKRETSYYKERYTGVDQAFAGIQLLVSKLSGVVWGYGHRVRRLLTTYLTLTIVFGIAAYFFQIEYRVLTDDVTRALGFWEAIYQAFAETLGTATTPFVPLSNWGRFLHILHGFLVLQRNEWQMRG